MAPRPDRARFERILFAATHMFARRGYRRTQMSDVAGEADVAAGSIYTYVSSKEALFHACLSRSSPAGESPDERWPLATPSPADTRALIERGMRWISRPSALSAALKADRADDPAAEVAGIVGDLYDRTLASRTFQALTEGAATDRPDLFEAFYVKMRRPVIRDLTRWIQARHAAGQFRATPDAATAARFVLESQAWFARHRFGDTDTDIAESTARATVVDMLVAALLNPAVVPRPGSA